MPIYDYSCKKCGNFREMLPMTESGVSRRCPICGDFAERMFSAPFLAGMSANGRNERPRNDPTRVPWRTACGFGCAHCAGSH
ncbi:MAG: zinc ribbon domain-containing protein [Betaproteobacteria bacterium]|nr:zinc ribbon domain-containing protein [Betaproteobacteria bacterium]